MRAYLKWFSPKLVLSDTLHHFYLCSRNKYKIIPNTIWLKPIHRNLSNDICNEGRAPAENALKQSTSPDHELSPNHYNRVKRNTVRVGTWGAGHAETKTLCPSTKHF